MAIIFGTTSAKPRGCFMAFTFDGQNSKGALLTLPDGTLLTNPDPTYPLVVASISTNFTENAQFLKCFNVDCVAVFRFERDGSDFCPDCLGNSDRAFVRGCEGDDLVTAVEEVIQHEEVRLCRTYRNQDVIMVCMRKQRGDFGSEFAVAFRKPVLDLHVEIQLVDQLVEPERFNTGTA